MKKAAKRVKPEVRWGNFDKETGRHTPEPWHYRTLSMDGIGIWTNDTRIYQGTREQGGSEWVADVGCETDPERIANAARIVLCVNAMSGIAHADPGSVKRLVEAIAWPQGTATPEFLEFIANRLVTVYGESPNTDFVISLRQRQLELRAVLAAIRVEGGA